MTIVPANGIVPGVAGLTVAVVVGIAGRPHTRAMVAALGVVTHCV